MHEIMPFLITVSFWAQIHIHVHKHHVGSKLKLKVMKTLQGQTIVILIYVHNTTVLCDITMACPFICVSIPIICEPSKQVIHISAAQIEQSIQVCTCRRVLLMVIKVLRTVHVSSCIVTTYITHRFSKQSTDL